MHLLWSVLYDLISNAIQKCCVCHSPIWDLAGKKYCFHNAMWIIKHGRRVFYLEREIGTSIVETFLILPSSDCTVSEPSLIGPILYPSVSILLTIICATSTALVMLFPLALITTVGSFANCTRVAVTYVIRGFLPMNISLLEVLCLTELVLVDIVRDNSARYNITFIPAILINTSTLS